MVSGDEVVRSSSFSACCDGGRGCHNAVLRGDHRCDVVWWSRWSKLGGAARDMVDVVWWSRWSELGDSTWSVVSVSSDGLLTARVARLMARRGSLDGSARLGRLVHGSMRLAQRLVARSAARRSLPTAQTTPCIWTPTYCIIYVALYGRRRVSSTGHGTLLVHA